MKTGDVLPTETHEDLKQIFGVKHGSILVNRDGDLTEYHAREVAVVPAGTEHTVTALADSKLFVVYLRTE